MCSIRTLLCHTLTSFYDKKLITTNFVAWRLMTSLAFTKKLIPDNNSILIVSSLSLSKEYRIS